MKRKILSLILAFAMAVSLFTVGASAAEPTYGDTAGHWAESSIERWSAYGIIQGSNGKFDPNGQLTCAQLATILARLLKLPAAKDAGFIDNPADAWYYDAINRCAAAGILKGNGDGTVTPEAPITRERAMVMLARALGIEPLRNPDLTRYTDAAQVSAYAQGYVAALIEAGIVGGVTADELAPQNNITRAATVTILDRAIDTYADEAGATVKADGKGLVLVVAENVKITGAPEGTKIVVADGATGLTVNGKSVSDDQTYIVPKATTGSGSSSSGGHSHSYTSTVTKEPTCTETGVRTYTCSCGSSTYTEEIPALGHEWGNWDPDGNHLTHTRTCSRCSYSETENCTYDVTPANDQDTYTCTVCGDTYEVAKDSAVRIGTTGYADLDTALEAADENDIIVLLKDATLNSGATGVQQGQTRNIKITGAKDITLSLKNTAPGSEGSLNYQDGANLTFNGIIVDASEIAGICARGAAVTFENCVFNTELKKTIANKFVFTGCTFTQPVSQVGYGCKEVLFDNCKFNTNGYGIKIYSEGSTPVNLTVKNSAFKNTGTAAKSAIFLDHIIDGISYSINLEKCTFEGFTSEPTPNENSWAPRVIVSDSFVKSGDQYVFSYQTGEKGGSYHKILTADELTVIIDGKLASEASGATLQEIINSKPESPVEITLAEDETVELKKVNVPNGYILYKKDTDDSSNTYQLMKNEGIVEVSLQELQNLKIAEGSKAADAEATTFTVGLAGHEIGAGDIAYSDNNSGYTGKGVLIGGTTMNSYGKKPANEGNYKFVITGGTINSAAIGYESIDGLTDTSVYMLVPGNSDVVFEGVTFNGVFSFDVQMYTSPWSYLNSITFKNCTFNGIIVGSCPAKEATFEGCVFKSYTNTTNTNNSNPIWWRSATGYWGTGSDESVHSLEKFTFVGNKVFGTRPVKIERIGWNCTARIDIRNNYFDISAQAGDTSTKNMAINIGQKDDASKFILIDDGNRISNNTASLYTAALDSGSNQYIAVPGTQVLDSNGKDKVIKVMVWKTTTSETFEMTTIRNSLS